MFFLFLEMLVGIFFEYCILINIRLKKREYLIYYYLKEGLMVLDILRVYWFILEELC